MEINDDDKHFIQTILYAETFSDPNQLEIQNYIYSYLSASLYNDGINNIGIVNNM